MDLLFVCLGNICRSPAAEGVARVLAQGNSRIGRMDSAGMGDWHVGQPPNASMREVARERGFPIDDLRARQVRAEDFAEFDWIIAMDRQNLADLKALQKRHGGKAKLRLLLDAAPQGSDVPDPYGGPISDFQRSFSLIQAGIEELLVRA